MFDDDDDYEENDDFKTPEERLEYESWKRRCSRDGLARLIYREWYDDYWVGGKAENDFVKKGVDEKTIRKYYNSIKGR